MPTISTQQLVVASRQRYVRAAPGPASGTMLRSMDQGGVRMSTAGGEPDDRRKRAEDGDAHAQCSRTQCHQRVPPQHRKREAASALGRTANAAGFVQHSQTVDPLCCAMAGRRVPRNDTAVPVVCVDAEAAEHWGGPPGKRTEWAWTMTTRPSFTAARSLPRMSSARSCWNAGSPSMGRYSWLVAGSAA